MAVPIFVDRQWWGFIGLEECVAEREWRARRRRRCGNQRPSIATLVEQIPGVSYTAALDEASTTLYVSPQIETLIGYSQAEYASDPDTWRRQLHPEDRERFLEEVHRAHEGGERLRMEYRMLTRDEQVVWVRGEALVVRGDSGRPLFL